MVPLVHRRIQERAVYHVHAVVAAIEWGTVLATPFSVDFYRLSLSEIYQGAADDGQS